MKPTNLLSIVISLIMLTFLPSCGSGLVQTASNLLTQGQEALAAWEASVGNYNEAKRQADNRMVQARATPSTTTIGAARTSLNTLERSAENVVTASRNVQRLGVGEGSELADALEALDDARDLVNEMKRELDRLLESLQDQSNRLQPPEPQPPEPPASNYNTLSYTNSARWGRNGIPYSEASPDRALQDWRSGLSTELNLRTKDNPEGINLFERNFNQYVAATPGRNNLQQSGPYRDLFSARHRAGEYTVAAFYDTDDLTSQNESYLNRILMSAHAPYSFSSGRQRVWGQGQYSAFITHGEWFCFSRSSIGRYCIPFYDNRDFYAVSGGAGYLDRPPTSATWQGVMAGTETAQGILLRGDVEVTYSSSNSNVDVEISDISFVYGTKGFEYGGPGSLTWRNLNVDSDGRFRSRTSEDWLSGGFFGPRAIETAGTFRHAIAVPNGYLATRNQIVGAFVASQ